MVIPECLGIAQSFVVTNDSLGVIAGIEADAAEVVTGLEAVEFGAVVAVPAVCGQGKGVVREVDVVFVEGFAEEQGVEGPDVKTRQVMGLQAPKDRFLLLPPSSRFCFQELSPLQGHSNKHTQ